jgi:hypothetical protein
MNDLEKALPASVSDAIAKARDAGRTDVAEFLALRASNDLIRTAAIGWLFDAVIEVASRAQASYPMLLIDRVEPHYFRLRGAELTGLLLEIRLGIRRLTVEAGWTRGPDDGFMRGGALAMAKFTHFGLPSQNIELLLLKGEDSPAWHLAGVAEGTAIFQAEDITGQFDLFMDV